ncbi:MAG TPA: formate dehydrogenase subunit delta [Steroidobacteraceae bacterium]|jgi:formate dehydrogenase subunit delta
MSHLVNMANDIGNFFRTQKHDQAVAAIANHIKSYWTRRMREKLIAEIEHGDLGDEPLDELPREAVQFLTEHPGFKAKQAPGGDAG